MKTAVTLVSTSLFVFGMSLTSAAQITIDVNDYPSQSSNFRTTYVWGTNDTAFSTPTGGANQLWNYQGIQPGTTADFEYFTTTDPFFSDSYHFEAGRVALSGFRILTDIHSGLDSIGYYTYGKEQHDTIFSIAAVTGGPMDQLHFVDDKQFFDGEFNQVFFPMTYQDGWIDTVSRTTPFEITVAGFGLNAVPGNHKRNFVVDKEIVGYGQLLMDDESGMPGDTMEVLLIQSLEAIVDSFFVGGAPAPATLLAGLGLSQGSTSNRVFHYFYRKGYGDLVLELQSTSATPSSSLVGLRFNQNAVPAQPPVGIAELAVASTSLFPNPVQPGTSVVIGIPVHAPAISSIKIRSIDGQMVHQTAHPFAGEQKVEVAIPAGFIPGVYVIQSFAQNGQLLSSNKLFVTQ